MKMTKGIMTAMIVGLFSAGALAAVPVESGSGLQKMGTVSASGATTLSDLHQELAQKRMRRGRVLTASSRPVAKTRCTAWRLSTNKPKSRRLSLLFSFLFRHF
jgi:ABC-type phosphate transport system substrate-binding protein